MRAIHYETFDVLGIPATLFQVAIDPHQVNVRDESEVASVAMNILYDLTDDKSKDAQVIIDREILGPGVERSEHDVTFRSLVVPPGYLKIARGNLNTSHFPTVVMEERLEDVLHLMFELWRLPTREDVQNRWAGPYNAIAEFLPVRPPLPQLEKGQAY